MCCNYLTKTIKQNSKDSIDCLPKQTNHKMKISVFLKSSTIKAYSIALLIPLIVSVPTQANAGFFNDLMASVVGSKAQGAENNDFVPNSQNVPLLETSISADMKDMNSGDTNVSMTKDGALLTDNLQGSDLDVNSYTSSSDKITTYTVKQGDTLGEVATKFGISKNTIIYANTNIKNNALKEGQILTILPVDGVPYTIKKGDTIASIAKSYKADTQDISEYNDISDTNLKIGDKIIVPGGVVVKKVEAPVIVIKTEKEKTETKVQEKAEKPETQLAEKTQASQEQMVSGNGITGGYIWPFPKGSGRVSQRLHDDNAYDFAAPKGTPIYAIQDGKVLIADGSGYNGGYGLYVVVDFDDGGQAIFGHMSKVATSVGETVKKGDVIGYVGSTGRSTGNHVHIGYHGGKSNPFKTLALNSNGL
jgi:murein DD-endopeptidase MepM/ murein hydrolase activator NlpD